MGNILIGLGVLALVVFIYFLARNEYIINEHDSWEKWWVKWLDNEERGGLITLATVIFLIAWGITSLITRGIVKEKYTVQKESTVISYGGTGYDSFTIGRYGSQQDGYYYVYEDSGEGLKELKLYSGSVDVLPNTYDDNSNTATLITESTVKKIKRSKMPFMFLSGKDIVKEVGGCGCGGGNHYILKVPTKFIFVDKFRENGR
jgi:hypothetical protein